MALTRKPARHVRHDIDSLRAKAPIRARCQASMFLVAMFSASPLLAEQAPAEQMPIVLRAAHLLDVVYGNTLFPVYVLVRG